jgi:hypothetical protein
LFIDNLAFRFARQKAAQSGRKRVGNEREFGELCAARRRGGPAFAGMF